jgi:pyrimidine-nucleoside phosphorylase
MGTVLFPQHVIARKRDGGELSREEIGFFVKGAVDGSWADYQLSALLMAIFLKGMTARETAMLTEAMLGSGITADLSAVRQRKADKHSTGGVGDKVSLHLAPMVAACGVAVPMVSGRGLGHTGGTLDKLESIPGFRVGLSIADYARQVGEIGLCLIGQTAELAPADRKLYGLRDVTATVECIPLICASILSKKLAEGIDVLVLDVKFGRGAFMADKARARELAVAITTVAKAMGKPTRAVMTAMDEPLGHAVGNALEVAESIGCLKGQGAADLMEVTTVLGAHMLVLAGAAKDTGEARTRLEEGVASGAALGKFRAMVAAQGGDARVADDPSLLPKAKLVRARLPERGIRDRCRRARRRARRAAPGRGPLQGRGPGRPRRRCGPPGQGGRRGEGRRAALPRPCEQRARGQGGRRDPRARDRHRGRAAGSGAPDRRDHRVSARAHPGTHFSSSISRPAALSQAAVALPSRSTVALSSRFRCWAFPGSL